MKDMQYMQDESLAMKIKLRNRRGAERRLFAFLDTAALGGSQVRGLCSGVVTDQYVRWLRQLQRQLLFVKSQEEMFGLGDGDSALAVGVAPAEALGAQNIAPQLEKLRLKAVATIRIYLLTQVILLVMKRWW